MKKAFFIFFIVIILISNICSCNESNNSENSEKSIISKPSEELLEVIRKEYIAFQRIRSEDENTLFVARYYGEYDGAVPVFFLGGGLTYTTAYEDYVVAGYHFHYNDGNTIWIWKNDAFYTIQEAYDIGILTVEQIAAVSYLHESGKYTSFLPSNREKE